MNYRSFAFGVGALFFLAAYGPAKPEGFKESLFNGKNLDGWVVTGCEAGVEKGLLVLKDGDGFVRSVQRYGDFILELDWKARKPSQYDSGIYIRADLPTGKHVWPAKYQVNLKQGEEGTIVGMKEATMSSGLVKPGDWNHFKITCIGKTAALEINGSPAWKTDKLENLDGFIGLQSEVKNGGQFEFRNFEITEIGFKPLFNGKDLTGWQGGTKDYTVEDGKMICHREGHEDLFTTDEYSDFAIRFEFKMEPGANNGLGIHAPLKGDKSVAYRGIEIQILDDPDPRYKDIHPYQAHGSVYGVVAAKRGHLSPVGEWNFEEVITKGKHIVVNLNGTTIVDADVDKASADGTIDHQDHPGLKRTKGYIGWLGHGAQLEFRNVRLMDLSQSK